MITESTVSIGFINLLFKLFEENDDWSTENITVNCILSNNLIKKIPYEYKKEIHTKPNEIHYLHLLKFFEKGQLEWHDHQTFEDKSYIIYMDNVGGTYLKVDNCLKTKFIPSEKGKMIMFDSLYDHKAFNDNKIRYVAAGGIRKYPHERVYHD
tara:strand:- start:198 stop:656 length:459 start_codon:yes stop_codon:yes gene_type:complete